MIREAWNALFGGGDGNVVVTPAAQVRQWVEAGTAVIVDVREAGEHAVEFIPGAVNIPLSAFDPSRVPEVPEGGHLVLHCQMGVRCGPAATRLVESGYTGRINRLAGGLMGWKAAGGRTSY